MAAPPGHEAGNSIMRISVPNCIEEGMVLMQGYDNYFVKCIVNPTHGGFYRVIYLCPKGITSVADTSLCIPPPDCAACGGGGGGAGGGGAGEDFGLNGLV